MVACSGFGYPLQYPIETIENDLESIKLLYITRDGGNRSVDEIALLTQEEVEDVVLELSQIEFPGLKGGPHSSDSFAFKLTYPKKYMIISINRIEVFDSNDNFIPEESHLLMYSEELDLLLKKYGEIYESNDS